MKNTDCRSVEGHLKAWLDGELDAPLVHEVEAHVSSCTACRKMADDFSEISRRLRLAAEADLVPEAPVAALGARFRDESRERILLVRALQKVAAAAALVLISTSAVLVWQDRFAPLWGPSGTEGDAASLRRDSVMEIVLSDPPWGGDYLGGEE